MIATALSEIVVGTVAQLLIGVLAGTALLGATDGWVMFLSGTGAILLTFLAGAELDPVVFRTQVEGVVCDRVRELPGAVPRLRGVRLVCPALDATRQLAGRRRAVDDLGRRGLCRDARAGAQRHRATASPCWRRAS
ncbi:MAG: hypothetical protein MZW92_24790 [Comamonadaceae bacterium]|nr:hypothetical protein [Comamonadaceae bacterium]